MRTFEEKKLICKKVHKKMMALIDELQTIEGIEIIIHWDESISVDNHLFQPWLDVWEEE